MNRAGGAPDMAALVPAWAGLYMPPVSNVNLKMLDLRVPSVVLPTPARHDGGFPAGVLLWGRPFADRRLLAFAMALEKALSPPESEGEAEAAAEAEDTAAASK